MPKLGFALADADAPGQGQGAYDVVLAFSMLHLVEDLDHALKLLVQALRPGGLLISKTPCINEMNPLIPRLALPLMQAIGKAPQVLCFDAAALQAALHQDGGLPEASLAGMPPELRALLRLVARRALRRESESSEAVRRYRTLALHILKPKR